MRIALSGLLLYLIVGCQPESESTLLRSYFPSNDKLMDGVVNKYYVHYVPDEKGRQILSDIRYLFYQLTARDTLMITKYRSDFNEIYSMKIHVGDTVLTLVSQKWNAQTYDTAFTIGKANFLSQHGGIRKDLSKRIAFRNGLNESIREESFRYRDTLIENRSGFFLASELFITHEGNDRYNEFQQTKNYTYLEGIGLFNALLFTKDREIRTELVKQMPLSKFTKLSNHSLNRIAFINPSETLDSDGNFSICGHIDEITDYYGSTLDTYKGGMSAIKQVVNDALKNVTVSQESGYLTYRFVVNCKGEAGRFVTEETSLDFVPKKFSNEIRKNFYEITKLLNGWQAFKDERGNTRDAYFYLTYKLKDGQLIDILP